MGETLEGSVSCTKTAGVASIVNLNVYDRENGETVYSIIPFAIYHFYAYRRWPEIVRWRFVKTWQRYKEVLVFSSYNLISP